MTTYNVVDLIPIVEVDFKDPEQVRSLLLRLGRNFNELQAVLETVQNYENKTGIASNVTVATNKAIWDLSNNITAEGKFLTSKLSGAIETLTNQINAGAGTVTLTNNDGILITDSAESPTKALRLLGGAFAIANSKDGEGAWEWSSFGTGDGFTADLMTSGQILTTLINIVGDKYYTKILGDGFRVYDKNGALAGHFGHYEALGTQDAVFTRATVAYKQNGSSVASGVSRFEYMRTPGPVWSDLFDTDDLDEYTSGGDTVATWAIADGKLTGAGGSHATLLKNGLLIQDLEIEVNCDQAGSGGIIARYQDNNNYYFMSLADDTTVPAGNNLYLYKRVAGTYTQLAACDVSWVSGVSKLINFKLYGSLLEGWFAGVKVFSVTDTAFSGGNTGLYVEGTTSFLDFKVYGAQQGVMVEKNSTPLLLNGFLTAYTGTINDGTADTFTGWSVSAAGTGKVEAVTGEFGGVACKITQTGATAAGQYQGLYQLRSLADMGLAPGDVVSAQVRYKHGAQVNAGFNSQLQFRAADGSTTLGAYVLVNGSTAEVGQYTIAKYENITIPADSVYMRFYFYIRSGAVYSGGDNQAWVDYACLEKNPFCTTPTDVARNLETLSVPTAGVFTKGAWTVELDYVPVDNPASTFNALWYCLIDANNYYRIGTWYDGRIYLSTYSSGVTKSVYDALSAPLEVGKSYRITASGDGTNIRLFMNGVQIPTEVAYTEPVGTLPATMSIGGYGSSWFGNGLVSGFRLSNIARTLAQHQADYNTGLPLTVDEYTTYLVSCNGHLRPTVKGFGLKLVDGEIYSAKISTAGELATDYIALEDNTFVIYEDSLLTIKMAVTAGGFGIVNLYNEGVKTLQVDGNNSNPGMTSYGENLCLQCYDSGANVSINMDGGIDLDAKTTDNTVTVQGDFAVTGSGKSCIVETKDYGRRKLYAVEAPDIRLEQKGAAQLVDGQARIGLNPIFLQTIEPDTEAAPWVIDTSPYFDTRLYISEINPAGGYFIVRECAGGTSSGRFAWSMSAVKVGCIDIYIEEFKPEGDILTSGWEDDILAIAKS